MNTSCGNRVDTLNRKLAVVAKTLPIPLSDLIDTRRSLRLELIVVVLIAFEIVVTFYQIYAARSLLTLAPRLPAVRSRLLVAHGFHGGDPAQQAAQKIGAGDDPFSDAPYQDEIILDHVIVGALLHHLHASDDVAEVRAFMSRMMIGRCQ